MQFVSSGGSAAAMIITLLLLANSVQEGISSISVQLKSTVAELNSIVTFTCAGDAPSQVVVSKLDFGGNYLIPFSDVPINKSNDQIRVTGVKEGDIETYTIEITALLELNETDVTCYFEVGHHTQQTGPKYLYIAQEKLGHMDGFKTPKMSSNMSHIVVNWSPPWSHSVNSYTVTYVNKSDNTWHEEPTDSKRQWTLERSANDSMETCHEFNVFITASTDIGDTNSGIVEAGHSIEMDTLSAENIVVEILEKESGQLKGEVAFEPPDHCSFTTMVFNYTVKVITDEYPYVTVIKQYGPSSAASVDIEDVLERNKKYMVEVKYWMEDLETKAKTVTKRFNTTKEQYMCSSQVQPSTAAYSVKTMVNDISSHEQPSTTSVSDKYSLTEQLFTSMTNADKSSLQRHQSSTPTAENIVPVNNQQSSASTVILDEDISMLITVSAVTGVLVIILFVALSATLLAVVMLVRGRKKTAFEVTSCPTNCTNGTAGGTDGTTKTDDLEFRSRSKTLFSRPGNSMIKRPNMPTAMATNPLYEGTSPLYSFLPDDLRTVDSSPTVETRNDLYMDIPPPVPLPRKQTLESPGVKSGVQLSLDKRAFLRSVDDPDSNDQYVQMQSNNEQHQRYVKSPSLKKKPDTPFDNQDDNEKKD